jgi:hypothetical protein
MVINKIMLAPLAGPAMFENRISNFAPVPGANFVFPPPAAPPRITPGATLASGPVQIADIYQAAKNRAIGDYEIDRLFNAEFYSDYQI